MRKRAARKRREKAEKLQNALDLVKESFTFPDDDVIKKIDNTAYPENSVVNWTNVPSALNPANLSISLLKTEGRAMRKQQQLESLIYHVKSMFPSSNEKITVVDFGCGQGHVGMLIASLYPNSVVTLLDFNPTKIKMIKSRLIELNDDSYAKRIVLHTSISDINKKFDLGVGLYEPYFIFSHRFIAIIFSSLTPSRS